MSGSGLLYLSDNPVKFPPVTRTTPVFYDETNQEIFAMSGDLVTIYNAKDHTEHTLTIDNAVNIISIKYSIDHRILAVQRSNQSVDFLNIQENTEFSQCCRRGSGNIIGFNWTCQNEIVFINHQAIEFYQINAKQGKVRHIKSYSINVNWFVYSPQFCVLVVSSTLSGNILHPFYFKTPQHGTSNIHRLPKFQVELPPAGPNQRSQLLERQVSIITLHGKLFLAITKSPQLGQESYKTTEICLYVLATEQIVNKVATLQLGITGRFALNCVDNMIVVHHQNSKSSMLFDVCWSPTSNESNNVLPLSTTRTPALKIPNFNLKTEGQVVTFRPILQPMSISQFTHEEKPCELYSSTWVVFQPGIIIDAKQGLLWELKLSVSKLSMHMVCSKPSLIKLLLHRRNYKNTIFSTLRSLILTQSTPLSVLGDIFDILNSVIDDVLINQDEMLEEVFSPLLTKEELSPSYKISVIVEYIRSLRLHKLRISYYYYEIIIQILIRCNQLFKLHQLVQFQVLGDSAPLACLLLSLDKTYEPAFLLGIDMLKRLNDTSGIVEALLQKNDVTAAIQYACAQNKEDTLDCAKFLQSAADSGDNVLFYSTYKFFSTRNERLRKSAEFLPEDGVEEFVALYKSLFNEL